MIIPGFSFQYKSKRVVLSETDFKEINGNFEYCIDEQLKITLNKKHFDENNNAVYWVLNFENVGKEKSGVLSDLYDCDILLPFPEYISDFSGNCLGDSCAKIVKMRGCINDKNYWYDDCETSQEFSMRDVYLKPSERFECETATGRSSNECAPFFRISQGNTGAIAAIGWTGGWKAEFERSELGIKIKTGLRNTKFYLEPGEKIRTSAFLIMEYEGDVDSAYNSFRRLIKNHFSLQEKNKNAKDGILDFELWGGLPAEESIKRLNKLKEFNVGFTHTWLDAGWYGLSKCCEASNQGDWSEYVGHWEINPFPHPKLMQDVKKASQDAGMKMMLWFEPERAVCGTPNTVSHPQWFEKIDNMCLLDLGNSDAWEYTFNMLCNFIEALDLKAIKYDFNTDPAPFWQQRDKKNRNGISEIKHIAGLYRLFDAIYEKYPFFVIENCSSGGRRIDIETLSRSVMICRSDYQCQFNANPDVTQTHHTNISCYLPYTGCFTKIKNDKYALRSAYSNNLGCAYWSALFQNMNDEELGWASEMNKEYQSIRHFFSEDFYNHGSSTLDNSAWVIWQYNNPNTHEGMIVAFRREQSPSNMAVIQPKGLLSSKTYEFFNYDTKEKAIMNSNEVLEKGYKIYLNNRESCIITYQCL